MNKEDYIKHKCKKYVCHTSHHVSLYHHKDIHDNKHQDKFDLYRWLDSTRFDEDTIMFKYGKLKEYSSELNVDNVLICQECYNKL